MLPRLAPCVVLLSLAACEVGPALSPAIAPVEGDYLASTDSGATFLRELRAGDRLMVEASALGCFSSSLIRATVAVDATNTWTLIGQSGFGGAHGLYAQPPMEMTRAEREGLDQYFALLRPTDPTSWCTNREVITLVLVRDGAPLRREVIDNSTCPDDASGKALPLASLFGPAFARADAALK